MKYSFLALISLAALILSACVNLKPKPDAVRKYTLGGVEASWASEQADRSSRVALYLMRPHLPGYLDSLELRYRSDEGAVLPIAGARWAEPLEESLVRALAQKIGSLGAVDVIGYYPSPQLAELSPARLSLIFERLDALESGEVHVVLQWTLRGPDGSLQRGTYVTSAISWQVGDAESFVAAYNAALSAFAKSLGLTFP